jgi:hypothetical protein
MVTRLITINTHTLLCELFRASILITYKLLLGFEVLTAVGTKMAVFWVVAPCSPWSRGTCCAHHQGGSKDL